MMRLVYAMMPAAIGAHVGRMFEVITRGRVPLLIHCTSSNDRTGAFAALLLHALGVPATRFMLITSSRRVGETRVWRARSPRS